MTKKWRESKINPMDIKFKNDVAISEIISYPPAGNDVFECIGTQNNKRIRFFLKTSRGSFSNIENEAKILNKLYLNGIKVPYVYDYGKYNDYDYIITKKLYGSKLTNLIKKNHTSMEYLFDYGKSLGLIHNINIDANVSMKRKINDMVNIDIIEYSNLSNVNDYLINNVPKFNNDTFIHGDFHYGNLLFRAGKISGILDFEYSGLGFKEQDLAWAIILRPTQNFMKTKKEILRFLDGYNSVNHFNMEYFKWCYVNGSMHFYMMNKNNEKYRKELLKMIKIILEV